eukprot:m.229486 g.229486  ORF g.229486 m.229486 type:complete len:613 (+) comp15212_c0_seq1:60-1898(+)
MAVTMTLLLCGSIVSQLHLFIKFFFVKVVAMVCLPKIIGCVALAVVCVSLSDAAPIRLEATSMKPSSFLDEFNVLPAEAKAKAMDMLSRVFVPEQDAEYLHVDATGHLFYADTFMPAKTSLPKPDRRRTLIDISPDRYLSNGLPIFHSRPDSSRTLYLDFDGHQQPSNTAWGAFSARPFDTSNDDPSFSNPSFSSYEQGQIADVWRRVAEDYAPFDIDVTTEEPASITSQVAHCLITASTQTNGNDMPAVNAGGVAYVDIFGDPNSNYYQPALAYYDNVAEQSDYIAEVVSHEIGHNMGLSHDGTSSEGYYQGDGDFADDSWGPIMGASYGNSVTQWSQGEYPDANNYEDDLQIIADKLTYRTDDHGDVIGTATDLTVDGSGDFSETGVITESSDKDVFKLVVSQHSNLTLAVSPFVSSVRTRGYNLDAELQLRDSSDTILERARPTGRLDADLTASLSPGTYYIYVRGSGHGDGKYTSYGSLGHYDLTGNLNPTESPLDQLEGSGFEKFIIESTVSCAEVQLQFCITLQEESTDPIDYKFFKRKYNGCKEEWRNKLALSGTLSEPGESYCFDFNAKTAPDKIFMMKLEGKGSWILGYSLLSITDTNQCVSV